MNTKKFVIAIATISIICMPHLSRSSTNINFEATIQLKPQETFTTFSINETTYLTDNINSALQNNNVVIGKLVWDLNPGYSSSKHLVFYYSPTDTSYSTSSYIGSYTIISVSEIPTILWTGNQGSQGMIKPRLSENSDQRDLLIKNR